MSRITRRKSILTIAIVVFSFILMYGTIPTASADTITINPSFTDPVLTGTSTNEPSATSIANALGYSGTLTLLYKAEYPTGVEGPFAGSYSTTFSLTGDPSSATINFVLGQTPISGDPLYLLVKDGDADPTWYLFNLVSLGWNGTDPISLVGFWPNGGAISNVAIFGVSTAVPEPGILILLGIALSAVGIVSRYVRKN